jgi:hypothetical protein
MFELCVLTSPITLSVLIYAWVQDARRRRRGPWEMCGISGGCACKLTKVCGKHDCECGREKICLDHHCHCAWKKACADLECRCGRPKVVLERHPQHPWPAPRRRWFRRAA